MVLGLVWSSVAVAHHDTAVQNVGAGIDGSDRLVLDDDEPRIEARLSAGWQSFGRLRQGARRFDDAEPTVAVERYTVTAGLKLASPTRLDVSLVTGRIHGASEGGFTLGDLTASLAQRVGAFRLGVQTTAPTGRYTVDAVSSVVDVQPDDTGDLTLVTYDARASLGAGAWRAGVTAGARGDLGPVVSEVRTAYTHTLGRTPDDIHWGSDVMALATVSVRLLAERVTLGTGLLGQLHTADRVDGGPEPGSSEPSDLHTSRRRSLGVVGTLGARVASGIACGAQAQVPLTQWVQGVQLAESFTVAGHCTLARALGKKRSNRRGTEG